MTLLQPDTDVTDNFVLVYGAELHYLEAGSGPIVILLHGLGGNAKEWSNVMGYLAEHFYVIALDQIGFGYSAKPLLNYRVSTLVDFLHGLFGELGIARASLIGEGLGGWVAAAFALQYPDKISRLVLVNAGLAFAMPDMEPCNLSNPTTREEMRSRLCCLFYHKDRINDSTVLRVFADKMITNDGYTVERFIESIQRREDVLDHRLSSLNVPTLIVHGREDELTPLALSERLHWEFLGSELRIIDRCGHMPHVEQPEEFNAAVVDFLDGANR